MFPLSPPFTVVLLFPPSPQIDYIQLSLLWAYLKAGTSFKIYKIQKKVLKH